MADKLKIAWITAELVPFVKIGGLADVSSALPKTLEKLGHEVKIVLPYYSVIKDTIEILETNITYSDFNGIQCKLYLSTLPNSNVQIFLLSHPKFSGDPYDNDHDLGEKFALFSWLVTRLFDFIRWYPDILHLNDWHTSIIPALLKDIQVKTILTIHNLAFQGLENGKHLTRLGLDDFEEYEDGRVNYMKLGTKYADQITTVSQTYAKEILTSEYGFGMEKTLQDHKREIKGIVHGIDLDEYNPLTDELIQTNYSIDSLDKKVENKLHLQREANLPENESVFVLGIVSRLYEQKGLNLLINIIPELMSYDIQCIILGTGDKEYEREFQRLEYAYKNKFKIFMLYDEQKSHEIFSGVDAFLIPSKFEPCGLTQLYSMRYGTVPIVRRTGGLADTVNESESLEFKTGFVFSDFDHNQFKQAIVRAKTTFEKEKKDWRTIQENGMKKDLSWDLPASKWIEIYQNVIKS